ncbi:HU family DNA-binding protein [Polynucleobacter kasalickyi]|uniref:DNA-binding protein HU-beta/DNA-binding protein HU-alpha n=1 Tax=Polynucleobacter kasalickyi TaxID=1938817 RepID=A0A1W1YJN1_9BURK|nr:HU family DNA-binding protein [Polynucleobacter kasalickyi]SMC36342.1 DNA-binding protein HU-beta/DNA-binding protein HU-alpha [Polynucleobacter kasalickyi]
MNKLDLSQQIAIGADISLEKGEVVLNVILKNIENALLKGESVQITGFGTFALVHRAARQGRNPKTGEAIQIEPSHAVKFSSGKGFKELLNSDDSN